MSIKDVPNHTTVAMDTIGEDQPVPLPTVVPGVVTLLGLFAVGSSSSSHSGEPAQIEEELRLISVGILPPCHKGLVSAFVILPFLDSTRVQSGALKGSLLNGCWHITFK